MSERKEQRRLGRLITIFAIMPAVIIIWTGCKKRAAEPTRTEQNQHEPAQSEAVAQTTGEPARIDTQPAARATVSLNDIIKAARTWRPAYEPWYGKPAPDFTLADLAGRDHRLSDYCGKNVLLVFWATWCPPCKREIPGLIELRNTVSEDNLAILAISDEELDVVKKFVAQAKINYTVLSNRGAMPSPFNAINFIPCSFFIDPEGKIKLATSGLISLGEIKAILQAP